MARNLRVFVASVTIFLFVQNSSAAAPIIPSERLQACKTLSQVTYWAAVAHLGKDEQRRLAQAEKNSRESLKTKSEHDEIDLAKLAGESSHGNAGLGLSSPHAARSDAIRASLEYFERCIGDSEHKKADSFTETKQELLSTMKNIRENCALFSAVSTEGMIRSWKRSGDIKDNKMAESNPEIIANLLKKQCVAVQTIILLRGLRDAIPKSEAKDLGFDQEIERQMIIVELLS